MKYNKTGVTLYYIDEEKKDKEKEFKNEEAAYEYVLSLKEELEDFKEEDISATVFYQERGSIHSASEEPLDESEEELDYEELRNRAGYKPIITVKKKKRNRPSR